MHASWDMIPNALGLAVAKLSSLGGRAGKLQSRHKSATRKIAMMCATEI